MPLNASARDALAAYVFGMREQWEHCRSSVQTKSHNPVQTKVKSDLKRGFRSIEVRCKANLPMMLRASIEALSDRYPMSCFRLRHRH